ncbi:MAG: transposase [Planctomycetes bacterium]|nr:transposase [Planctomycetota bacterium]
MRVPPGHRKICRRYNEPGHAHSLTFSCFQQQQFLSRDRTRQWLVEAIDRARKKHQFHLWAYVIMPEHVHLLLWPTRPMYTISSILSSLKMPVTKKALLYVRQSAPSFLPKMEDRQPNGDVHYRFWQRGGGYDRNIIEPTTIWAEMDYIHANPVRRKLCDRSIEWPWSSAAWCYSGVGLLAMDVESLPRTKEG